MKTKGSLQLSPCSWGNFKSSIQHTLKEKGDKVFIIDIVSEEVAEKYWLNRQYKECFYIVALVDYVCRINSFTLYSGYNEYRKYKLEETLYPQDIELAEDLGVNLKSTAYQNAIPEFLKFNIIEGDVRNVC